MRLTIYYTSDNPLGLDAWWEILLVGLGIPFLGIFLSAASDNPVWKIICLLLISIPLGLISAPWLGNVSGSILYTAGTFTLGITITLTALGVIFPATFASIGGGLMVALALLVIVRILQIFIPALTVLGWIDYLAAGLFSLYIAHDMAKAYEMPKTITNAVMVSFEMYLNIFNLFINIVKILSND